MNFQTIHGTIAIVYHNWAYHDKTSTNQKYSSPYPESQRTHFIHTSDHLQDMGQWEFLGYVAMFADSVGIPSLWGKIAPFPWVKKL